MEEIRNVVPVTLGVANDRLNAGCIPVQTYLSRYTVRVLLRSALAGFLKPGHIPGGVTGPPGPAGCEYQAGGPLQRVSEVCIGSIARGDLVKITHVIASIFER